MGLFHKTLKDINRLLQQHKFDQAKIVLDQHMAAEHHAESDVAGLQQALNNYRNDLKILHDNWTLSSSDKQFATKAVTNYIKIVARAQNNLKNVQALISKLRKDARLELK